MEHDEESPDLSQAEDLDDVDPGVEPPEPPSEDDAPPTDD